MAGATDTLPDIRDVFFDGALRDMGFAPKSGLDGKQLSRRCASSATTRSST